MLFSPHSHFLIILWASVLRAFSLLQWMALQGQSLLAFFCYLNLYRCLKLSIRKIRVTKKTIWFLLSGFSLTERKSYCDLGKSFLESSSQRAWAESLESSEGISSFFHLWSFFFRSKTCFQILEWKANLWFLVPWELRNASLKKSATKWQNGSMNHFRKQSGLSCDNWSKE